METDRTVQEFPEELPGQMVFFPEEEVPHVHIAAGKPARGPRVSVPDLTHPPFICILLCDIV